MMLALRGSGKEEVTMLMTFGIHKGEEIGDLPDSYLIWLETCNTERWRSPFTVKHASFKIPSDVEAEARQVLEWRGLKKTGAHWER
jgi:hypothetical protein